MLKSRAANGRLGLHSFDSFLAHIHSWCTSVAALNVSCMADAFGYTGLLLLVANNHGGKKATQYYSHLPRPDLALTVTKGSPDVVGFVARSFPDQLRTAKMVSEQAINKAARVAGER